MKPGEQFDTNKTTGLATALNSATLEDVVCAGAKPDQPGWDHPATITLDTFDGFTYTLNVRAKTNDTSRYCLAVAVTADLPKARTPGKDEKPEDKAKLDREFQEMQSKPRKN